MSIDTNSVEPNAVRRANRVLVGKLGFVVVLMFGFGFALVPLYDVLCDITGLNGKAKSFSCSSHGG